MSKQSARPFQFEGTPRELLLETLRCYLPLIIESASVEEYYGKYLGRHEFPRSLLHQHAPTIERRDLRDAERLRRALLESSFLDQLLEPGSKTEPIDGRLRHLLSSHFKKPSRVTADRLLNYLRPRLDRLLDIDLRKRGYDLLASLVPLILILLFTLGLVISWLLMSEKSLEFEIVLFLSMLMSALACILHPYFEHKRRLEIITIELYYALKGRVKVQKKPKRNAD